jgi:hypothetical protein
MNNTWPNLDFQQYKQTVSLVHLWTQIIGKIRLRKMPWLNHSWHVSLYVSPRGFTTGSIPDGLGLFEIEFDFINHLLHFRTSAGTGAKIPLGSQTVAQFHQQVFDQLDELGIEADIHAAPNEMDPAIPFAKDNRGQTYDPAQMTKLWQAFVCVHKVFQKFRAGFIGKCSPVHLFWGAFDLAVTRFSGRKAPEHPGGMPNMPLKIMQEAYSHEVSSAGFWPGSDDFPQPVFYSYCYPTPEAFSKQQIQPEAAFYSDEMGEFFLSYSDVQSSDDPDATLMNFLETTYRAAADTGSWDPELEFDFSGFE